MCASGCYIVHSYSIDQQTGHMLHFTKTDACSLTRTGARWFGPPSLDFGVPIYNILHLTHDLYIPYLSDCKPRLIKFFFIVSCGLQSRAAYIFHFFTLSKGIDDVPAFLGCVIFDQTLFSHYILFSITCTYVTGAIMTNRRQLWRSVISRVTNNREKC